MPVEKPDVVDFMTVHPKTREVVLAMVETRDWKSTPEALPQLEAKLEGYSQIILSGALVQQRPELANKPLSIRLEHFSPITPEIALVLRRWAGRLSGVPVPVNSHRLYWNRVVTLIQKLKSKLKGDDEVICWAAEAGKDLALLSRDQFAEEFATVLRTKAPNHQMEFLDEMRLKLTPLSGEAMEVFLANAYNHYCVQPENKLEIISKYVTSILQTLGHAEQPLRKDRIVPIIKDKDWLGEVRQGVGAAVAKKALEGVHEVYNEELIIAYAEDNPNSIHYLTPANLEVLRVERKDLRKLACSNLERVLPVPDIQFQNGIYRIRAGGDYEASLLLMDSFWDASKLEISGDLVVAIPARDFLIATGSKNRVAIRAMKAMAETVASQAPYRLTSKLFVRRAGRFVGFP